MSNSSNTTGQQGGQQPPAKPSTPKDAASTAGHGSRRI